MEEENIVQKYRCNIPCYNCIHHFLNNGEFSKIGCRAFPNGIPNIILNGNNHNQIIKGQVGNYVFKKALYNELSPLGKILYNRRNQ